MKISVVLALLAAGLTTGASVADDVLLTNGESFEGVIARLDGRHVRIQLEFGELRLPASSVERIDSSESALSEYLERRRTLLDRGGSAGEWLELARWARVRALGHRHREALLEAASLDPHLDGLAPGMRQIGYVFDQELDRWISADEKMSRAGFVRRGGEWTRPGDGPVESERSASDDRRELEETLSRTVEILALAQLERETRESRESRQSSGSAGATAPYGFPVAHFPGHFVVAPEPNRSPGPAARPRELPRDLFRRQPGSLLPVGGANSGARFRQPGSLIPTASGR